MPKGLKGMWVGRPKRNWGALTELRRRRYNKYKRTVITRMFEIAKRKVQHTNITKPKYYYRTLSRWL